jgi:hypothetical protein
MQPAHPTHLFYIAGSKAQQNFEQWPKKSFSTESAVLRLSLTGTKRPILTTSQKVAASHSRLRHFLIRPKERLIIGAFRVGPRMQRECGAEETPMPQLPPQL